MRSNTAANAGDPLTWNDTEPPQAVQLAFESGDERIVGWTSDGAWYGGTWGRPGQIWHVTDLAHAGTSSVLPADLPLRRPGAASSAVFRANATAKVAGAATLTLFLECR